MRKFGKYEKMPDGTRAKQPAVKSVLLQTYFTSLICMVLCVTMFLGTTFAWFTREVTNTGNEIHVGMLDVGLYKMNGDSEISLDSNESPAKLFDSGIYWEPGYTTMETIKIKNEGNLSFRYALTFTANSINDQAVKDNAEANALMRKVAENFVVYVHPGEFSDTDPKPTSFADIKASAEAEDGTWRAVRMGKDPATLADILEEGFPVLSGNMEIAAEEDTYILALHMKETAGEGQTKEENVQLSQELMGKCIDLNVKLTAYQRTHEEDAFNKDYDLKAHVTELGALDISATSGIGGDAGKMTLDAAYQFQPVETFEEWNDSTFRNYTADFVVWSEQDIPANSVVLAGYYEAWCQYNHDNWVYLQSPDPISANTEIPLVAFMGNGQISVHYKDLCQYGNDGIGFLCGIKNLSAENIGKVIIVELRMFDPNDSDNYIVAGRYEYALEAPSGTIDQIP